MLLTEAIDRLAGFEPVPFPVLSLYLDARPNEVGRDSYEAFLRKAFRDRLRTYRPGSPEHASFTADVERITAYLSRAVDPSSNGLAIFACAGADGFFEALQLEAPIDEHRLYVDDQPHLYPLARMDDQFPRYAAVVADTNFARIFVFGTGQLLRQHAVQGVKTKHTKVGGWSQARYQRHVGEYHQQHAKEVSDQLDRIVRHEGIQHIVIGGDEVLVSLLRSEMPHHLVEKIVDVLQMDVGTAERDVLESTLAALRRKDAETDGQAVDRLFDAVRSGGLGVLGAADTLAALELGQPPTPAGSVSEGLAAVEAAAQAAEARPAGASPTVLAEEKVADQLVTLARQTAARIRFIEEPALLAEVGGVGALLRFKI
jgi:peptide chain release factor subunit 1